MNIEKYIERSNETFNNATKEEKRVIVAKDVLYRIKKGLINPEPGNFMDWVNVDLTTPAKDFVNSNKCEVCAKGALFCAFVGRVNKIEIGAAVLANVDGIKDRAHRKLAKIFSYEQLDLIEIAFEGTSYMDRCKDHKAVEAAKDLYNDFGDPEQGLIIICKNIIKNKGVFIP